MENPCKELWKQMEIKRAGTCIVNGCYNHESEGTFIGAMCSPCYEMITRGKPDSHSNNFINQLNNDYKALQKQVNDVVDMAVVNWTYRTEHEHDLAKCVRDMIDWEVKVALDPKVSKAAQQLIGGMYDENQVLHKEIAALNRKISQQAKTIETLHRIEQRRDEELECLVDENKRLDNELTETQKELERCLVTISILRKYPTT